MIVTVRPDAAPVAAAGVVASDLPVRARTSARPDQAQASVPVGPVALVASAPDRAVTAAIAAIAAGAVPSGAAGTGAGEHAATFARPSCSCSPRSRCTATS